MQKPSKFSVTQKWGKVCDFATDSYKIMEFGEKKNLGFLLL